MVEDRADVSPAAYPHQPMLGVASLRISEQPFDKSVLAETVAIDTVAPSRPGSPSVLPMGRHTAFEHGRHCQRGLFTPSTSSTLTRGRTYPSLFASWMKSQPGEKTTAASCTAFGRPSASKSSTWCTKQVFPSSNLAVAEFS